MVGDGALLHGQPAVAQQASPKIQDVYRYAVDHGETLQYIPCFCGCAKIGHHHNANCYIAERRPDGRITFTNHGATGDICLNITRDAMAMQAEGIRFALCE